MLFCSRYAPKSWLALAAALTILSLTVLGLLPGAAHSRALPDRACSPARLQQKLARIASATHGPVGAAVLVVEGGPRVSLRGEQRFPMQSVYKLPIAMAVLHQVDLGRLSLTQPVKISPGDLVPPSRGSPIRDRFPHGTTMMVSGLLDAMMSVSDGTASDVLLRLAGGPQGVTAYLHGLGLRNIVVATTEAEMAQNEQAQYRNWATPNGLASLLNALQSGRGLSVSSHRHLLGLMTASTTGLGRIKGLLPAGTVVAHKTGSSGTVGGVTRATNDIGLVTLPDGRHLVVVVLVSDTRASSKVQEAVIAGIARAAWDCRTGLERGL